MASPAIERRHRGIVIGVVIQRHIDRGAIGDIAIIFLLQRVACLLYTSDAADE